ncbi:MAG TPA: DUF3106 domain-containing protein [Planctomycetota bacterium]|nr:DUF3106 domain-containing protein [Planctomycetota bacterium]
MTRTTVILVVVVLAALTFATTAAAQTAAPVEGQDPVLRRNYERWQNMSEEERAEVKARFERWKEMSPEERERIRHNLERFEKLPEEKQEAIRRAGRMMHQLGERDREGIRKRMRRFHEMSPERRRVMMQRVGVLRGLLQDEMERARWTDPSSPEMRLAVMELRLKARVLHAVTPEELERLRALPAAERKAEIDRLVRERGPELPREDDSRPPHGHRMGPEGEGPGLRRPQGQPPEEGEMKRPFPRPGRRPDDTEGPRPPRVRRERTPAPEDEPPPAEPPPAP